MTPRALPTVSERFQALLGRLSPTDDEQAKALARFLEIKKRLKNSFQSGEPRVVGSLAKGTFVRGHSDVDVFAPISIAEARWGENTVDTGTFLRRVRDELRGRYRNTEIRRDRHAVAIRFKSGIGNFDVVPAIFIGMEERSPVYAIPDGRGGWMPTSPDLQMKHLKAVSAKSGGKLLRVIQIIKWWNRISSPAVALSSFHIEAVLTSAGIGVGVLSYAQVTAAAFQLLADRAGSALRDPYGLSHLIYAVKTDAQKKRLALKLGTAAKKAAAAVAAEAAGKNTVAVRRWGAVFHDLF
jgi:hypothetical protein